MKILALGAHPDDVEIGCGGLLLKSSRLGYEIYIYILTHGEAGTKTVGNRDEEAFESANTIGAKKLWLGDFADTKLVPDGTLVNSIEKIVKNTRPDLVLTHSIRDEHHDHRAVGLCSIEAARYIPNILLYENPQTIDFIPQIFVDISDVIEEKIQILNLFKSQKEKEYLKSEAIRGLAQYRALQSRLNIKLAEAYQVIKLRLLDTLPIV